MWTTSPGHVTKALIEKLKQQLLQPQQLEKLERIRDKMKSRQFMIKSFNQAIQRHISMRPGSSHLGASYCDEADLELFDLAPTTITETYRVTGNIPEMCKFSYCEPCSQVMPPRSEHCEFCKKCILRVDHHCIWMGNSCVGLMNHKFFILYLVYLT